MILLWGPPGDGPLAAVRAALGALGAPVFFLDQRRALETHAELHVGRQVEGHVSMEGQTLDLGDVTAAYLRPHDSRRLPEVRRAGPGSAAWEHAARLEDLLFTWTELTAARVINRLSAMAPNGSKPFQALQIRAQGFRTPATLITTDPAEVRAFQARHGAVIYKSISGVRSIVSRLGPEHDARLEHVRWCPTQFQQHVPGIDHRVHVVGDNVFTARIRSTADDYRYASRRDGRTYLERGELPPDIAARCLQLARALDLPVAGIDLRRTPEGEWYCFEVNPSPGFTWFQEDTGDAIDAAVARLLCAGSA